MAPEEFFVRNSEGLFWAGSGQWVRPNDLKSHPYRYSSYEAACADVSRVLRGLEFEVVVQLEEGWQRYTPPITLKMDGSTRPNKVVRAFKHVLEGEVVLIRWSLKAGGFYYMEVTCPPKATREAQALQQIDASSTELAAPGGTA